MERSELLKHLDALEKLNEESIVNFRENNIEEAERLSKSALQLAEKYSMENSHAYTNSLCILGEIYTAKELYKDAVETFKRALRIMDNNGLKVSSGSYSTTLHKYGFALMKTGNYKESVKSFKTACKYYSKYAYVKNEGYPVVLLNLGYAYNELGHKLLAEISILRAIRLRKKVEKENPLAYAEVLHAYAVFCDRNRRYAKAYNYYKKAAKIRFLHGNVYDEEYLQSIAGVAFTAMSLGMYDEALHLYKNIVSICEEYDNDSIKLGVALTNLAFSYDAVKDFSKSREYYNRAIELFKKLDATDTADYATLLHNFGCSYQLRDKHAKAIDCFEKALQIRKKHLGVNHPDYVFTMQCLVYSYAAVGDVDSAEDTLAEIPKQQQESGFKKSQVAIIIIMIIIILIVLADKMGWL